MANIIKLIPKLSIFGHKSNSLLSIAVKMTALANPNHMAIGQLVYDLLDDNQKSLFVRLTMSPEIWSYVNINTGGTIYNIYTVQLHCTLYKCMCALHDNSQNLKDRI